MVQLSNDELIALGQEIWDMIHTWIDNESEWNFSEETSNVKMYKRKLDAKPGVHEKGTVIMGVGFVPHANLDDFVHLVLDPVDRKLWDTSDFYDAIAKLDDSTDICHVGVPSYGPISARDFVSIRRAHFDKEAGSYTAVQVSIEYDVGDRKSMTKKHVRGTLLPSCWRFVQKPGGCETHYVSGVQLGGWMPQSVVDKFVYTNTYNTFFANVRKIFKERHEKGETTGSKKEKEQPEEYVASERVCED